MLLAEDCLLSHARTACLTIPIPHTSSTKSSFQSLSNSEVIPSDSPGCRAQSLPSTGNREEPMDDWQDSTDNARNWTLPKKWTAVSVVSCYSFVSPFSSSMMAPGLTEVAWKYNITNSTTNALTLSIFLLSYGIGPLFLAPLSEMYGRKWVLHFGNLLFITFNIGCAFAPTANVLIGFRFLAGFAGSASVACGGGLIGDLFAAKDRASAMAVYNMGTLIGPIIGPIAGGFVVENIGVRYVFVLIAAQAGVAALIGIPLLRETYAPIIRSRKAKSMPADSEVTTRITTLEAGEDKLTFLWINLSRPLALLCKSFICFLLSLYLAFTNGIFYLMFATFSEFFGTTYGFKPGIGGLVYLGLGVGSFAAAFLGIKFSDRVYNYLVEKNGGKGQPEMRIPSLFLGSLILPIGVFWYGWSAQAKLHWIMPIIGSGIFGFGLMTTYLSIQLYLVDAFKFAASATAAAALFRSLLGFVFPLFGQQMFDTMGLGGGCSLLGGLAIVLGIPFPVWVYYKGEVLRAKSNLTR